MRWEDNIFGKVRTEDWLQVGNVAPTRPTDPIDRLFGDERTDNLVAKWESIAQEYQIPVMAQFHGFDTESNTTFRIPIDTHSIEKGLIKVKINQSERLRALARAGVVGDQELYNYVMDDGIRLADQVITRTKVAKNELLATGKVTIKENNLDLAVDYGVPVANTQFTIDFSDDDILGQIETIVDTARDKGVILSGIVTSRKVVTKMRKNKGIQTAILGTIGQGTLVTKAQLDALLADEFGLNFIIENDLRYGASASIDASTGRPVVVQKRCFPENKISFVATNPTGNMGVGLWGNPPEVDTYNFENGGDSPINPYVYIMQWAEKDPAVLWTKASSLFMPVLYNPDSLYIATATGDASFKDVTVQPEASDSVFWGTTVSDLQSNVVIGDGKITGTLKYYDDNTKALVQDWGAGNFMALKFSNIDPNATSVKVGMSPSQSSGLVEIIDDPDKNGVFKVANTSQKFKVVTSDGTNSKTQIFDLSDLTLQGE